MDTATLPIQSDYETERGKPTPSNLHSVIQTRLSNYLMNHFSDRFDIFTELTLDTPGEKTTPDIAICLSEPIDFSKDEVKRKEPPIATIEILSPTQVLQTLLDKTNDYFSFGVKSCWVILPTLKTIYVYHAPYQFEVFSPGDELYDAVLDVRLPIDMLFASTFVVK